MLFAVPLLSISLLAFTSFLPSFLSSFIFKMSSFLSPLVLLFFCFSLILPDFSSSTSNYILVPFFDIYSMDRPRPEYELLLVLIFFRGPPRF
jgi:hypothetical protein